MLHCFGDWSLSEEAEVWVQTNRQMTNENTNILGRTLQGPLILEDFHFMRLILLRFHFLFPCWAVLHISLETKVISPENPKWDIISLFTELCWSWIICHPGSVSSVFLSSHYQQQQGRPKRFSLVKLPWHLSRQELAIVVQMPRNPTPKHICQRKSTWLLDRCRFSLTLTLTEVTVPPLTTKSTTVFILITWQLGIEKMQAQQQLHRKDNCIHLKKYSLPLSVKKLKLF